MTFETIFYSSIYALWLYSEPHTTLLRSAKINTFANRHACRLFILS